MNGQFKPGDVVRLKSGGPSMTVSTHDEVFGYRCQWFVGNDLRDAMFKGDSLELAKQAVQQPRVHRG